MCGVIYTIFRIQVEVYCKNLINAAYEAINGIKEIRMNLESRAGYSEKIAMMSDARKIC